MGDRCQGGLVGKLKGERGLESGDGVEMTRVRIM